MTAHTSRPATLRFIVGYAAIASALPYLVLKLVWLSGGTLGVSDPGLIREPSMFVLNAVTAGMDVAGIGLALAFTHGWGSRVPAWLLLPPIWVATGLLARFVVGVPIVAMLSALAPGSVPLLAVGPVRPWVYVLVYIEFAGMGAGLMWAFFYYARARWADAFEAATHVHVHPDAPRRLHVPLANATAPVAIALGLLHLAWAFGSTLGLPAGAVGRRTAIATVVNATDGVLMMAGVAGVLMMVHRGFTTRRAWLPVAMAWTGTASLFAWGLWQTINVVGETALVRGAEGRAFVNLVGLARLVVGLVMGLLFLMLVVERERPAIR